MNTISEADIQQIKESIGAGFAQVNTKLEQVNTKLDNIDKRLIAVETTLSAWKPSIDKVSDLAEKVGELRGWKQIALVVISAFGGGLFGWFLRRG